LEKIKRLVVLSIVLCMRVRVYMITHHHLHMSYTRRHYDRQDVLMSAHLISCSCSCRCSSSSSCCCWWCCCCNV